MTLPLVSFAAPAAPQQPAADDARPADDGAFGAAFAAAVADGTDKAPADKAAADAECEAGTPVADLAGQEAAALFAPALLSPLFPAFAAATDGATAAAVELGSAEAAVAFGQPQAIATAVTGDAAAIAGEPTGVQPDAVPAGQAATTELGIDAPAIETTAETTSPELATAPAAEQTATVSPATHDAGQPAAEPTSPAAALPKTGAVAEPAPETAQDGTTSDATAQVSGVADSAAGGENASTTNGSGEREGQAGPQDLGAPIAAAPAAEAVAPAPTVDATPTADTTTPAPVAAPTAMAPTASTAPTAAAPAQAATPAAPPATQLAQVIAPLKLDGDGIHRLSINLHPADLGPVNVIAELRNGDIHIHLAGATDAGREALRAALPDLRRELQAAGYDGATFDMSQHAPRDGQQHRPGAPKPDAQGQGGTHTAPAASRAPDPPRPAPGNRLVDLHV